MYFFLVSGELIGIEYLFNQSGQALEDLREEDTTDIEAEIPGSVLDEGFEEGEEEDDPTVSLDQSFLPSTSEAVATMLRNRPSRSGKIFSDIRCIK